MDMHGLGFTAQPPSDALNAEEHPVQDRRKSNRILVLGAQKAAKGVQAQMGQGAYAEYLTVGRDDVASRGASDRETSGALG